MAKKKRKRKDAPAKRNSLRCCGERASGVQLPSRGRTSGASRSARGTIHQRLRADAAVPENAVAPLDIGSLALAPNERLEAGRRVCGRAPQGPGQP